MRKTTYYRYSEQKGITKREAEGGGRQSISDCAEGVMKYAEAKTEGIFIGQKRPFFLIGGRSVVTASEGVESL